jgi:hypothetical protein
MYNFFFQAGKIIHLLKNYFINITYSKSINKTKTESLFLKNLKNKLIN